MRQPTTRPPAIDGFHRHEYLILLAVFALSICAFVAVRPTVHGDGVGYFAYLRSVTFDHDLQFADIFRHFNQRDTLQMVDRGPTRTGLTYNIWSIGPAIMWAPFYGLGHLFAVAFGFPVDGYSSPYVIAIAIGTATWVFIGILMAYRLCRERFGPVVSLLAISGLWFASSLTAYTFFHPTLSHGVAFFAVTGFFFTWWTTRGARKAWQWVLVGVFWGLMMLCRPQSLVFAMPAVVLEVIEGRRQLLRVLGGWGGTALVAALMFSPQMVAWWLLYGRALTSPYSEFDPNLTFIFWKSPHMVDVLMGANHGMLTWTPILIPALIGLARLCWQRDRLAMVLAAGFVIQVYVVSAWYDYWQGASFGGRMFVDLSLAFMLGLGAVLDLFGSRALLLGGAGLLVLAVWNALFMLQYGSGALPLEGDVSWPRVVQNQIDYLPVLLSRVGGSVAVAVASIGVIGIVVVLASGYRVTVPRAQK